MSSSTDLVRVAGLGTVCAYGRGTDALVAGLGSQLSAVRAVPVDGLGARGTTALIGRVPDEALADHRTSGGRTDGPAEAPPSRFGRALFAAAREAVADAKNVGWIPGERVGLIMATTLGEAELRRELLIVVGGEIRSRRYLSALPSTSPSMMMQALGFSGGPAMNVQAACAGTNTALLTAKLWLESGWADDVLVVGCDFPNLPEDMVHFYAMEAARRDGDPLDVCRPFQEGTRGFVTGEGAAAMVITRRGTTPYGYVLGGAMTHDPYHPIGINPDYSILSAAYAGALADAGVDGRAVRWFNAHGAGTRQGDKAELAMLEQHLPNASIFSVKPMIGHAHGAAGGLELAVSLLAYRNGRLAVAPRVAPGHPSLLTGVSAFEDGGLTVKASMGMGGYNAVVVLGQGVW